MEIELKENERLIDWEGEVGTARNIVWREECQFFDFHRDTGEIDKNFIWVEGPEAGAFVRVTSDA